MSRSSRTGGYEIPRETDYQTGEDDTILDRSLYTATDHTNNSLLDKSTVISTATTVKQSSGKVQIRKQLQRKRLPVLDTSDIQPKLESYQQNRSSPSFRFTPQVVTPQSATPTDGERSTPSKWGCLSQTSRQERTSDVYSPDALKGLALIASPDAPDATGSTVERISKMGPASTSERSTSSYRFEFAEMEQQPTTRRRSDDGAENVSVHSISFSQTEEEIGFEVDDPYSLAAATSDDRDDESSASELSIEVSARIHDLSDSDLLGGRSSPGALRLTSEGLKEHEKKTFQEARRQPEKHADEFEAWRKEHETRKWHRQRLKERERKLSELRTGQSLPKVESQPKAKAATGTSEKKGFVLPLPFRAEEGVADLSTAPLVAMQHLQIGRSNSPKKRSFPLFRKKGPTVEELLERERQLTRESKRLQSVRSRQEKERIALKRRQYLEQQRANEVAGARLGRTNSTDTPQMTTTTSTMSSLSAATPSLPYCVLCLEEVRTHIATPCMHFSFCANCVEDLEAAKKNECPVCRHPNVSYASVAV